MSIFDFGKHAARRKRRAARQKALQERRRFEHELDVVFKDMHAEIQALQTELTWKPVQAKAKRLRAARYLSALASLWVVHPRKAARGRRPAAGRPFQQVALKAVTSLGESA